MPLDSWPYAAVELDFQSDNHTWRKNRDKPSSRPLKPREDDILVWERFVGVATEGREIKHTCLSALMEHYHWASRGEKYCKVLRTAARAVPVWAEAAIKLNRLMLGRHQPGRSGHSQIMAIQIGLYETEQSPAPGGYAVALAKDDTHSLNALEATIEGDIVSEFVDEFLAEQLADAAATTRGSITNRENAPATGMVILSRNV
ncbi:hypothetical protein CCUS01_09864 [Colletotrichum cuscutae]|uniref:Uncharacterized protein n=1 Tax=Colletotrichum cuscutae TaxID=1209917 RepID=A0AAI9UG59_9PEZI|nr:hypothetical protein CCUS01_09864 [Colletotrichum cuscutae]